MQQYISIGHLRPVRDFTGVLIYASGAGCGGSIPLRRTIRNQISPGTVPGLILYEGSM